MNASSQPRVSVIMPAHNREDFIAESIESVLAQTFTDYELIIVDDGSTDRTLEIAKTYERDPRVKVIVNEKNLGIAQTRNKALALARAEYIAILDSDDIWLDAGKLEKQARFLDENPDYALVGGNIQYIDVGGAHLKRTFWPETDGGIRRSILRYNLFAQSSLMYRKSAAMACGAYDASYVVSDDYNLWLCMGSRAKFAILPDVLTGYRMHGSNITRTKRLTAAKEMLEIVRANRHRYPGAFLWIAKAYLRLVLAYVRT